MVFLHGYGLVWNGSHDRMGDNFDCMGNLIVPVRHYQTNI